MTFAINELMRTVQYILLMEIFFQEQLFIKKRGAGVLAAIYLLGFCGLVLLGQENKLYLLGAAIQIAMSLLFLRDRWYGKVLSILMLLAVPSIIVLCLNELNGYAFDGYAWIHFWEREQIVSGDAEFFLITVVFFLLRRKKKFVIFVSNRGKGFLSAISILFLTVLEWSMASGSSIDNTTMMLLSLCNVLLVGICIWVLFVESSWKQNQLQTEQYMEYVKRLEEEHDAVKSMYHDLKHHLRAIDSYVQSEDMESLKGYLFDLGTEASLNTGNSYTHYTSNPLFNAVLSEKQKRAEAVGAQMSFHGSLDQNLFVRAYDLCVIISNLMDNALEHVEKAGNGRIEVYASQDDNCILLQVINDVDQHAEIRIGKTTKSDKLSHGYGLRNIKKAAQRYYGDFDIYVKDGRCIAKVMLMRV